MHFTARESLVFTTSTGLPKPPFRSSSASILSKKINGRRPEVKFAPDRYADLRYLTCDITKAKELPKRESKVIPEEGIRTLIEWIRSNKHVFAKEGG